MFHLNIVDRKVGDGCSPFIIAELSGNHQQSYQLAEQMIEAAAKAGADAIKLQTYTADTITLDINNDDFTIQDKDSLWKGEKLYDLYNKASTPWEWHKGLFEKAKSLGLVAFSSPFDATAVDFLETLDVPCYKIASFENNDLPLIKKVAETGKPIIVSTGMASKQEITELLETIYATGNNQVILLKCTSNYPADASDANLSMIKQMRDDFNCLVGLSDHFEGTSIALAGVALGACVVEKHFVIDRSAGGVDAEFSLQPNELKQLIEDSEHIFKAIGKKQYDGSINEQKSKKYRRSIYCSQSIKKGQLITPDNIKIVRPAFGLAPKYYEQILGKQAYSDIEFGTAMSWELID